MRACPSFFPHFGVHGPERTRREEREEREESKRRLLRGNLEGQNYQPPPLLRKENNFTRENPQAHTRTLHEHNVFVFSPLSGISPSSCSTHTLSAQCGVKERLSDAAAFGGCSEAFVSRSFLLSLLVVVTLALGDAGKKAIRLLHVPCYVCVVS